MRKMMTKKVLLALSIAFVASAAVGVNALTADAAATDAFSTLALQNGASVRYIEGAAAEEQGFSYVLEMDKAAYEAVKENEDYTNVQYGILIGPEAYYKAHAFNSDANIEAYYTFDEEVAATENKAFIYNMKAVELVGEGEKVFYRGSIVEVQEANMFRDYRGVGYVSYSYQGGEVETYYFTDNSNVRCPVEIAEKTIETLDAEENATQIEVLEDMYTSYLETIDWTVTPENQAARTWTQSWGIYEIGVTPSWVTKYNNNRYINSKYTTTWAYEKAGKEPVAYKGWAGTAEEVAAQLDLEGAWTLTARTTNPFLADEVVSFSKQVTFLKLGGADCASPTVNGVNVPKSSTAGSKWDEATGSYNLVDPGAWGYVIPYAEKATGNFIADFRINAPGSEDFRIYTSASKWVGIRTNVAGNNGFFLHATDYASETNIKGTPALYTQSNGLNLRVVMYNGSLYYFANTYTNDASEVVERAEWLHVATMNKGGLGAANGMTVQELVSRSSTTGTVTGYTNFMNAATSNEFGFAIVGVTGSGTTNAYIDIEDNDALVEEFILGNSTIDGEYINNQFVFSSQGYNWVADDNGYYNNAATGIKAIDTTSGDYMVALKLKSSSELDFRVYYSSGEYFGIVSASQANNFFMDSNAGWWSESRIGYNTAKFVNDNFATTKADGYLDLMLVRYQGEFYIYGCEYADEAGAVQTFENWQLLVHFKADKTTPAGDGIVYHNANGDVVTNLNGNLTGKVVGAAAANENAFVLRTRGGNGFSAKVVVTDTDAAVAAFMASEKAVATYAKA